MLWVWNRVCKIFLFMFMFSNNLQHKKITLKTRGLILYMMFGLLGSFCDIRWDPEVQGTFQAFLNCRLLHFPGDDLKVWILIPSVRLYLQFGFFPLVQSDCSLHISSAEHPKGPPPGLGAPLFCGLVFALSSHALHSLFNFQKEMKRESEIIYQFSALLWNNLEIVLPFQWMSSTLSPAYWVWNNLERKQGLFEPSGRHNWESINC